MNDLTQIENLLKEAKSVDSKTLKVDEEFKESLRETLYENYLNQVKNGGSIMAKIKSITLNWKVGLLSFALLAVIASVVGAGVSILSRKETNDPSEVLLAANLAVADGEVMLMKEGEDRWMEAKQGDTLRQGDAIKTSSESRAVLELDNGDALRLNSNSEVSLTSLKPENVVVDQLNGESYSRVAKSEKNTYTVKAQEVEVKALGTAYTVKSITEKKQVQILVYESKVKLNLEEKEVDQLKKATVNTDDKSIKVEDMNENEFKSEFAEWNKQQDKQSGKGEYETQAPKVQISSPKNRVETDKGTVTLKGTVTDNNHLRKIKVNGEVYTSKNGKGKGFDPKDGTFEVDVKLSDGKNSIKVVAYDVYWNASEAVSVVVTKKAKETSSSPSSYFYVSSVSSPKAGKIYVKWTLSGYSASSGFKIVAAKGKTPVYPGDYYTYRSDPAARDGYITGLSDGTYNVRVCIYNGSGGCNMYTTNMKSVTVSGDSGDVSSISLSSTGGSNIQWSVSGYSDMGFKVVWSKNSGPTYPLRDKFDKYHYFSDPNKRSDTLDAFDGPGTYYVRVCEYLGGKCGVYSNQITVTL